MIWLCKWLGPNGIKNKASNLCDKAPLEQCKQFVPPSFFLFALSIYILSSYYTNKFHTKWRAKQKKVNEWTMKNVGIKTMWAIHSSIHLWWLAAPYYCRKIKIRKLYNVQSKNQPTIQFKHFTSLYILTRQIWYRKCFFSLFQFFSIHSFSCFRETKRKKFAN